MVRSVFQGPGIGLQSEVNFKIRSDMAAVCSGLGSKLARWFAVFQGAGIGLQSEVNFKIRSDMAAVCSGLGSKLASGSQCFKALT